MGEVGVRELRDHLSRWLARVQAGEEVVVTERGKPIARIVPARSRYDEMVAAGLVIPPKTADRSLPAPIETDGPVTEFLAEQRR